MLHLHESLKKQVNAALLRPGHNVRVLEGLRLLGVRRSTIAEVTGVSASLISHWYAGQERVSPKHHPKLVALLRAAHKTAVAALGEAAAKPNFEKVEAAFNGYRSRACQAGAILTELEQHRCNVDTTKRLSVSPRSSTSAESGT